MMTVSPLAAGGCCQLRSITADSRLSSATTPPRRGYRGRPATRLWAQATVHNKILNVLWDFYNILRLTKNIFDMMSIVKYAHKNVFFYYFFEPLH